MDIHHAVSINETSSEPGRWWPRRRPHRRPVRIGHQFVSVGGRSVSFDPLDATDLLEAYLRLVRRARRQRTAPDVTLRRDDIEVLASHLASTPEVVIDRLGSLMGATRAQRLAMASLFASGAMVVGLVSTAAAEAPATEPLMSSRPSVLAAVRRVTSLEDVTMPFVRWTLESYAEEREGGSAPDAGDPPTEPVSEPLVDTDLEATAPEPDVAPAPDDTEPAVLQTGLPPVPPQVPNSPADA